MAKLTNVDGCSGGGGVGDGGGSCDGVVGKMGASGGVEDGSEKVDGDVGGGGGGNPYRGW